MRERRWRKFVFSSYVRYCTLSALKYGIDWSASVSFPLLASPVSLLPAASIELKCDNPASVFEPIQTEQMLIDIQSETSFSSPGEIVAAFGGVTWRPLFCTSAYKETWQCRFMQGGASLSHDFVNSRECKRAGYQVAKLQLKSWKISLCPFTDGSMRVATEQGLYCCMDYE